VTCINPLHDHTTTVDRDGMNVDLPIPMLCNDCALPTHYDEAIEDYVHDDDEADACFLAGSRADYDGASPCFPLAPRVTTLGGLPRILLDHRILVMMLPGFGDPNTLMEYENGYAQVRMPERSPS
jgi:hypothetical protein